MGNSLIKSEDNRILKDDTVFAKEITEILKNKNEIFEKVDGEYLQEPVNQIRACCMNVVKEKPTNNDFISIKLPIVKNNLSSESYGLQFKGKREELCSDKFIKGNKGICDGWMINNCAKDLYDNNCIEFKKDDKTGKYYKVWNKKCIDKDGNLKYGKEECVCINSAVGFNLNNNPSDTIKGGFLIPTQKIHMELIVIVKINIQNILLICLILNLKNKNHNYLIKDVLKDIMITVLRKVEVVLIFYLNIKILRVQKL